jgi:copper transport protein
MFNEVINNLIAGIGLEQLAYWLSISGLLMLFGGTWFHFIIIKEKGRIEGWKPFSKWLYGLTIGGLVLLLIDGWMELPHLSWGEFITLKLAWVPLVQIANLSLAYFLRGKISLLLLTLTLCLFSFTGHSDQPRYGDSYGIIVDSFHLMAIGIWLGGLVALILMAPREDYMAWLKRIGQIYAKWAFGSILTIILSGIWMTKKYVPSFSLESLVMSGWGQMLFLKVLLLISIIVLGYRQRRALSGFTEHMVKIFLRRTKLEIVIGAMIIFVAAILISYSPTEAEQGIYPHSIVKDGVKVSIKINPHQVGANDITIYFENAPDFEKVNVVFSMPPNLRSEYTAFSLGEGVYFLTGNHLHGAGTVYLLLKAMDTGGKTLEFPFRIQVPGKM